MHRRMPKKRNVALLGFVVILFLLTGCQGRTEGNGEELICLTEGGTEKIPKEEKAEAQESSEEETRISRETGIAYVHVCGQVANPGVYPLPSGSRLYEAIEAAGGLLESGAGEQLNQAAQVEDGQRVYVPSKEEVQQGLVGGIHTDWQGEVGIGNAASQGDLTAGSGKVNLNTASKEQLMTLSGIGEAKAMSIIAYREEHGGFQKVEELMEVQGIKEGVFNKVRDRISIN